MQTLEVRQKIIDYRSWPWINAKVMYHGDATKNPVFTNKELVRDIKSVFFGEYSVSIPESKITSIQVYNPNVPQHIDELIVQFAHLFGDPFAKPVDEEQDDIPEPRGIQDTSLLDDAMKICNNFRVGWEQLMNKTREPRQKLNNIKEENNEIFLADSVPMYAYDMYEIIDLLVTSEGMKSSSFPNYKQLYKSINEETDQKKRAMDTRKLCMLLEAKIPASVKYKRSNIVTPVLNQKVLGSNDMENFKSTSGK